LQRACARPAINIYRDWKVAPTIKKHMTSLWRKLERIARFLSGISETTGRLTAWLTLAMTLLVCYDVAMRYIFHQGSVALQELEWHLFALLFLLGAAYTLKHDAHVRVEVFYQHFGERGRAWADLIGNLLFLLPFCLLVIYASTPFVYNAFHFNEGSPDPGGLPYRYLLKAAIPVGFGLLLLQGIANILDCLIKLFGRSREEA
jgi:TRAP-type mannitol/chloroaromatic compound transport system permease small subunit